MADPLILEIEIQELDPARGYPIRLLEEGQEVGTGVIPKELPDSKNKWTPDAIREKIDKESASSPDFREIGEYLFALLDCGDAGTKWKALLTNSRGLAGRKLRTTFRIHPKELRGLPWELMLFERRPLFADAENPMSRSLTAHPPMAGASEALPLRILVVVGAAEDDPVVKWKEELEALRRSFHNNDAVEMEELIRPTAQEVIRFLRDVQPHVFHFIGHGRMNEVTEEAELLFWNGVNRVWSVDDIIRDLMTAGLPPPLVFLNACRSGDVGAGQSAYEMAQVFLEQGSRCVVGMQGNIGGKAATVFAARVYEAIAVRQPLDSAIAAGRAVVADRFKATRDWALPTLHLAYAPHAVLPREFGIENAGQLLIDFRDKFQVLVDFVDRRDERRGLCSTLLDRDGALLQQNLIIVLGPDEIGKSGVVGWCARHLRLRGRQVHYRNLANKVGAELRNVLESIRHGIPDAHCSVLGPLPAGPFEVFDRKLKALDDSEPEADDPIPQLAETFIAGLSKLAEEAPEPVVLVLDQFELMVPNVSAGTVDAKDFTEHLKPLFDGVAAGAIKNLKIVVVIREKELSKAEAAALANKGKQVRIGDWPGDQFELLARLYAIGVMKKYQTVLVDKTLAMEIFIDIGKRRWVPADLKDFRYVLKMQEKNADQRNG